jgi:phage terminase small subunit
MKAVGTYHESHDYTIKILAQLLLEHKRISKDSEESDQPVFIEHTNVKGQTNTVKNPAYQVMEKIRADILIYSRELGLTPVGLKRIKNKVAMPKFSLLEHHLINK